MNTFVEDKRMHAYNILQYLLKGLEMLPYKTLHACDPV